MLTRGEIDTLALDLALATTTERQAEFFDKWKDAIVSGLMEADAEIEEMISAAEEGEEEYTIEPIQIENILEKLDEELERKNLRRENLKAIAESFRELT